jgi:UDP-N-acetylglucosamine 2-epimerase (non-hydrolysing)
MTLKEHGGASILVGNDLEKIKEGYRQILEKPIHPHSPPLWDGNTAERILDVLLNH